MIVKTLWGVRKYYENGPPELMEAWDEYTIDNWPEGWEAAREKAIKSWGDELAAWRIVDLVVCADLVKAEFLTSKIQAVLA